MPCRSLRRSHARSTSERSIAMRGFSRLILDGQVLDGVVDCQSAADAWCGPGASAFSTGCASIAADSCVPDRNASIGGIGLPSIPELPRPLEVPRLMPGVHPKSK